MNLTIFVDRIADAIRTLNTASTPCRRVVGGGVVVNSSRQLLMAYSDFAYQGWHFPKGGVDEGETILQGALREVYEESGGVIAQPLEPLIEFHLQAGRVYREPIQFGSPRTEKVPGHAPSDAISLGAAQMLQDAAIEAGIPADFMAEYRFRIFDELVKRSMQIYWVTVPTYYLMAYVSGIHQSTWESEAVDWHPLESIPSLRPPHRPHHPPRIGGAAKTILQWPALADLVEQAATQAQIHLAQRLEKQRQKDESQ